MTESQDKKSKITDSQWALIVLVIVFTAGGLAYRLLMNHNLGHSAAMFLGIPALLAILLALTPKTKSVTGGILKGITLALLIAAPLVGEGYLCILMAAPLFYLVGIIIGVCVDWLNRKRKTTLSCCALLFLAMALEGVIPQLSFNRNESVEATAIISATPDSIERQLSHPPDISSALPSALAIGFPRPLIAQGEGLQIGALRRIHFSGAEGDPPGDLLMQVTDYRPGYMRFQTISDASKLTQWIRWQSSEVEWKPVDATHTSVTWRVHFQRQLDPAWYFAPIERVAVYEAAKYLIVANATPHTNQPADSVRQ